LDAAGVPRHKEGRPAGVGERVRWVAAYAEEVRQRLDDLQRAVVIELPLPDGNPDIGKVDGERVREAVAQYRMEWESDNRILDLDWLVGAVDEAARGNLGALMDGPPHRCLSNQGAAIVKSLLQLADKAHRHAIDRQVIAQWDEEGGQRG
jgi:hypothetical protein